MSINSFLPKFTFSDKMKTRNVKILSGAAISVLIVLLLNSAVPSMADTRLTTTGYDNKLPEVWYLKQAYRFCQGVGSPIQNLGGSTPDGQYSDNTGTLPPVEDVQNAGCIEWAFGERTQNYVFTGEQIAELVVVRDPNGHPERLFVYMDVDGRQVAQCSQLSSANTTALLRGSGTWYGHSVKDDLLGLPQPYPTGYGSIPAGFNSQYDALYQCLLTVTPDMCGDLKVEVEVSKDGLDPRGNGVHSVTDVKDAGDQTWSINPPVQLDISDDTISFPQAACGVTVPSDNTLTIANTGSKVEIAVWLGGTDFYSPDVAAQCPFSNVLDVDKYMTFDCIKNGMYDEQIWQPVKNKDLTDKLGCWLPVGSGVAGTCFGLRPIFTVPALPMFTANILLPSDSAECKFKLAYPCPCDGEFTEGSLVVLMRAV